MCKLVIEQNLYQKVEFVMESPVDASIMIEQLKPYAPEGTRFIVTVEKPITTTEGEEENDTV